MKTIIPIVFAYIILALCLFITIKKIKVLSEENLRLLANQSILLAENGDAFALNQAYIIADSLNGIKASELQLSLDEYKQYRTKDLKLIKQLKNKNTDLQRVITAQTETLQGLTTKTKDSIICVDNRTDTLKCFTYKSKYTELTGCLNLKTDSLQLQLLNKESLKVIETIQYKRFLGFLWRLNSVKARQVDIISDNPQTKIVNCEYISVRQ